MSRRRLVAGLGAFVVWISTVGCAQQTQPGGTPIERVWESPGNEEPSTPVAHSGSQSAQSTPTDEPGATSRPEASIPMNDILVVVNGEAIRRSTVVNLLMECHGLSMVESLVLLTAAKQKAAAMSLTVTPADVKAAHEDALRQLATPVVGQERPPLDRSAAERLLREFLAAKNISQREWDIRMEQRAIIRKIAEAEIARTPITDEMLRSQYEQDYGDKVQIRHIQLGSLAEVTRAKALLTEKDFELVAREMSTNEFTASQGGLMPPFTRNDPGVPPLLRETAFSLKVGEVSTAIHEQNRYQLIKLERRFPASSVGFENADKDKLRASVRDRLTRLRMDDLEAELFRGAAVDIRDKNLNSQFREKHRVQK